MLKITRDLESYLNFIYETYVLEDDKNLDIEAKKLKQHYKYVIEDIELHNCLEIEKEVEEKKKLLTEDEKEFLKQYIKMSPINIEYIQKRFNESESITVILNDGQGTGFCTYYNTDYFKDLEKDKKYTLKELGLEEN